MPETNEEENRKRLKIYARISSAVIQMAVIITASAYFGQWLDEKQGTKIPIWTLILCLFGIAMGLFILIREILRIK